MKKLFILTLALAGLLYVNAVQAQVILTVPDMPPLPAEIQELVNDENGDVIVADEDTQSFPFLTIQYHWASYGKKAIIVFFILPPEDMDSDAEFAEDVTEKSLVAVSTLKPDAKGGLKYDIWYNKPLLDFVLEKMREEIEKKHKIPA